MMADSGNANAAAAGGVYLPDDLDMDFATLFDPTTEEQNMNTHGSGWPSAGSAPPAPPGNVS